MKRKSMDEYEVSRIKDMNDPKSETEIGEIVTRFEHPVQDKLLSVPYL